MKNFFFPLYICSTYVDVCSLKKLKQFFILPLQNNTMLPKASLGDTQLAISCEFDFYVHLFLNKPPYDTLRIDYQ